MIAQPDPACESAMSAHPAPASPTPPAQHPAALRNAELSDLLGHLHNCWDNERRSLSRQLHDSLGSSLTALTMHLACSRRNYRPIQPCRTARPR
jgi:signal transduction histidine kinase